MGDNVWPKSKKKRKSYHIKNLHTDGQWAIWTCETEGIRANAHEQCPEKVRKACNIPDEVCILWWCEQHGEFSDQSINDRWAASRTGERTSYVNLWDYVRDDGKLLRRYEIRNNPTAKPSASNASKMTKILRLGVSLKAFRTNVSLLEEPILAIIGRDDENIHCPDASGVRWR